VGRKHHTLNSRTWLRHPSPFFPPADTQFPLSHSILTRAILSNKPQLASKDVTIIIIITAIRYQHYNHHLLFKC